MITIKIAICGALFGWFATEFEPFQVFLFGLEDKIKNKKLKWIYSNIILKTLSCAKCTAFWFTILTSCSFFTAVLASAIVYTFKRLFDKMDKKNIL